MNSLFFLIPLSVVVCIIGVTVFFWAVRSGQYDDLDAEGERILFDEEDSEVAEPSPDDDVNTAENDSKRDSP
ncbi:MAG: cbb3-type cytochrome oxidase assembly protein CcoS [bacterium]